MVGDGREVTPKITKCRAYVEQRDIRDRRVAIILLDSNSSIRKNGDRRPQIVAFMQLAELVWSTLAPEAAGETRSGMLHEPSGTSDAAGP
jgi:hypothetical protein